MHNSGLRHFSICQKTFWFLMCLCFLQLFYASQSVQAAITAVQDNELKTSLPYGSYYRKGRWLPVNISIPSKFSKASRLEIIVDEGKIYRWDIPGPGEIRAGCLPGVVAPQVRLLDPAGVELSSTTLENISPLADNFLPLKVLSCNSRRLSQ